MECLVTKLSFLEAVSLSITKESETIDEAPEIQEIIQEGDVYFSVHSYVAEAEQAIDLVEGERVYVIETPNADWWLVKKHLTEEKGWVPAQILMDEPNYTMYVQKKLNEKIDKLPVFESEYSTYIYSVTSNVRFRAQTRRKICSSTIHRKTPTRNHSRRLHRPV